MRDCTKCSDEQRKVCDELRDQVAAVTERIEGEETEILCPMEKPPEMPEKLKGLLRLIVGAFEEYASKLESAKAEIKKLSDEEAQQLVRLVEDAGECKAVVTQATLVMPGALYRALGFLGKPRASLILGEVVPNVTTVSSKSLSGHMEVDQLLIMNSLRALTADRIPDGMNTAMQVISYGLGLVSEAYGEGLRQFKEFWEKLAEARKAAEADLWLQQAKKESPHGAN